ncbi:ABC transporter substrate-binding protein [Pseudomonas chlororaphis]|uniref:ABC transporter substrate-binding protein n=1 Tax=Pseudomonas chlororaphis TaxID=587753 RepID=UPI0006A5AE7A|nr:extracellular solute-binding protein [Pseudomonas chlororaphis]AZD05405.1 putative ABC transporter, periplasmic substrate- binding protein [Pseudomonas chlororaphis subsp. chlororaphis]MBM0284483.1 extracellular solute-binding protein [Pseudomonas chlororaphis]MDO1507968.1 extracellular solute-binding protein [Pseudomonas chlororaphis]ORM48011.1 ABC transporter permease [Pseudomonas chlororaphis subsp. chlororaphis]TWR88854.1 extracellular solute-binding protein [Pseudomonas chlororaphis su
MTELNAISSMEHAELAEFIAGISQHIGMPVRLTRCSTSELIERLHSGSAGAWDLLLGTAATALLDPALAWQLMPLTDIEFAGLPDAAVATDRRWFAASGFVPAFCYDPKVLAREGLSVPTRWQDLTGPEWAGRIALPDPARSGAGYLHLSALLEHYGEPAWALLAQMAGHGPAISGSSTAPIEAVVQGQAWLGVTVSTAATRAAEQHPQLRWCVPEDARCYEDEVFACRAGSPNAAYAQQALQWMLTPAAAQISQRYGKVVPGQAHPVGALQPLAALQASRDKAARCRHWQALFSRETAHG